MKLLADAWPELRVVAQARNGREAVEHFEHGVLDYLVKPVDSTRLTAALLAAQGTIPTMTTASGIRERLANAGNVKLAPGCTRSKVIIFRCNGMQPKPDLRKQEAAGH